MGWWQRKQRERDLERELRSHLELEAEDQQQSGLSQQDAHYAAAILSLALGIGANTAIFSLINALLLRSLPVPNPAGIVQLLLVEQGRPINSFGYPSIGALAGRTDSHAL